MKKGEGPFPGHGIGHECQGQHGPVIKTLAAWQVKGILRESFRQESRRFKLVHAIEHQGLIIEVGVIIMEGLAEKNKSGNDEP